jgi:hypothetical protein
MTIADREYEVAIVGAGPVGLSLAIELGKRGVDVCVVERRRSRLRHPKASRIHSRTMEIFRQQGMADDIRRVGNLPLEIWAGFGYLTRLNKPDLGWFDLWSDLVDELRLMTYPFVVGAGQRLFSETSSMKPMQLINTRTVGDGLVFLTYQPVRNA